MINKQLSRLCIVEHCFLFEGRVYEVLYKRPKEMKMPKYRFMLSDDDYDYVVDRNLKRRLDRFLRKVSNGQNT